MILIAFTLVEAIVGVIIALSAALYWGLSSPVSTPREIAAYVLVTLIGAVYLLVTGISPLDPAGTGIIAFLGAGALGYMLIAGVQKLGQAFPHAPAKTR